MGLVLNRLGAWLGSFGDFVCAEGIGLALTRLGAWVAWFVIFIVAEGKLAPQTTALAVPSLL
jgi:hypothetical protein